MTKPYEEPTMEFRQVRTPLYASNGLLTPTLIGYQTNIQQKWLVYPEGVLDSIAAQWVKDKVREGWRDLPTVDEKDAK